MLVANEKNEADWTTVEIRTDMKEVAEKILEKNLEDITALLSTPDDNKSHIYDDIMDMVDRSLLRISLRRSNNVRSAAASYLGINRNTLQKKIARLDIGEEGE
jgi:DNA-binding protein Fis